MTDDVHEAAQRVQDAMDKELATKSFEERQAIDLIELALRMTALHAPAYEVVSLNWGPKHMIQQGYHPTHFEITLAHKVRRNHANNSRRPRRPSHIPPRMLGLSHYPDS